MNRKIIVTGDGSKTIQLEHWNEQYHSKHGAIQEAYHVFIKNGLRRIEKNKISILEIGFGTGLNAFITYLESRKQELTIDYVGVEAYPVIDEEIVALDYVSALNANEQASIFRDMHASKWSEKTKISREFSLTKLQIDFLEIDFNNQFDLIYFDAFGPRVQPELWTESIFKKMFKVLKKGGWLTTYSAKGDVRRAMMASGFVTQRVEGPPGKREMLVAEKN